MADETTTEDAVSEPAPALEPVIEATPPPEPISEPQITKPVPTAQPVEPLDPEPIPEPQPASEPVAASAESSSVPTPEPIPELEPVISEPVSAPEPQPTPTPTSESQVITPVSLISRARELLLKARETIQFRKRKKLEKIMGLFLKKQSITNDDVQKLLYVSDATATRYLKQLETEGRIRRQGVPGHASYSRI